MVVDRCHAEDTLAGELEGSDLEVYLFLTAAQGDTRSNILQAPKVTTFNGAPATIQNTTQINYIAGAGELAVLCGAVLGAGLGFLWFNAPPASIFMGDTGSLALGGMLGAIAVAVKHEIVLAVIGGLFVLEAVSVIVQVASFKLTGKRIFKMAPIHHHFEQLGWTEPQIVIRFWIISVMLALAGLSTLKLR